MTDSVAAPVGDEIDPAGRPLAVHCREKGQHHGEERGRDRRAGRDRQRIAEGVPDRPFRELVAVVHKRRDVRRKVTEKGKSDADP
jgi:hypothetical protein